MLRVRNNLRATLPGIMTTKARKDILIVTKPYNGSWKTYILKIQGSHVLRIVRMFFHDTEIEAVEWHLQLVQNYTHQLGEEEW